MHEQCPNVRTLTASIAAVGHTALHLFPQHCVCTHDTLIMCRQLLGTSFFLLTHKLSDAQFAWIHTDHTNSFQSVHSYTFTWHTCNHAQITKRALAWKNELKKIKREGKKRGTRGLFQSCFWMQSAAEVISSHTPTLPPPVVYPPRW